MATDYERNLSDYLNVDTWNIGAISEPEKQVVIDYARRIEHVRKDHAGTVINTMLDRLGNHLIVLVLITTNYTSIDKLSDVPEFQKLVARVITYMRD